MSDTAVRPRKAKGDAELRAMLRQAEREKRSQAEQLAIARKIKAEKRAARIKAKVETGPRPVVKQGDTPGRPGKGSMILRYYLDGRISQQEHDAGVEYTDLHRRLSDAKIGSYGDTTRGGGDGSAALQGRMRARAKLKRANVELDKLELPTRHLVEAVCVEDWAASDWLRDIDLDANMGLPMLRRGLSELVRHWGVPARRSLRG